MRLLSCSFLVAVVAVLVMDVQTGVCRCLLACFSGKCHCSLGAPAGPFQGAWCGLEGCGLYVSLLWCSGMLASDHYDAIGHYPMFPGLCVLLQLPSRCSVVEEQFVCCCCTYDVYRCVQAMARMEGVLNFISGWFRFRSGGPSSDGSLGFSSSNPHTGSGFGCGWYSDVVVHVTQLVTLCIILPR